MNEIREAIRFAEEYGYNKWTAAQAALNELEAEGKRLRGLAEGLYSHLTEEDAAEARCPVVREYGELLGLEPPANNTEAIEEN